MLIERAFQLNIQLGAKDENGKSALRLAYEEEQFVLCVGDVLNSANSIMNSIYGMHHYHSPSLINSREASYILTACSKNTSNGNPNFTFNTIPTPSPIWA